MEHRKLYWYPRRNQASDCLGPPMTAGEALTKIRTQQELDFVRLHGDDTIITQLLSSEWVVWQGFPFRAADVTPEQTEQWRVIGDPLTEVQREALADWLTASVDPDVTPQSVAILKSILIVALVDGITDQQKTQAISQAT